jgi:hypothetical protein
LRSHVPVCVGSSETNGRVSPRTGWASDLPPAPVTPARIHAPSHEPHVRLDPESRLRIAIQPEREDRHQEALNALSLAIDDCQRVKPRINAGLRSLKLALR